MDQIIYVYDVKPGKHQNPRRTKFNKTLFGFKYKWETQKGQKTRLRQGLVQLYKIQRIGDSVIAINPEHEKTLDQLFNTYQDIIQVRKFLTQKELKLTN